MTDNSRLIAPLKKYLDSQVSEDKFSGSVLIAEDFSTIFEFSYGSANREKQILNTINTKYNLGSANKMFTGVAIAQLAEKNLLSFDDPVGTFLSNYPNKEVKENVTIHHLLTHTSGLGSFIDLKYRNELLIARSNLTTINTVIDLFKEKPLESPIGEFRYSSNGYELLGAIIEAVSGLSYYEYIKQNIYEKANMLNSESYTIDPKNVPDDIAIGYTNRHPNTDQMQEGEKFNNFNLNLFKGTASGAGYSTCYDLLNFAKALLEYRLLSENMTKLVMTPKIKEGSKGNQTKYDGYGFQIFDIDGVLRIGHPGRFSGVNVRFDMYPSLGYVVIVLANYDPPAAFDVAEKVTEIVSRL